MESSFMERLDFWVHLCREMDLSCTLLTELSLGKAALEFESALDVQAEKYLAALNATTLSEGNTIVYQFPQCGIQLASGLHQNGSCISTRVFETCMFCLIVPEILLSVQYPVA